VGPAWAAAAVVAAGGARPSRGYDLETEVSLTLDDVAEGRERDVEFTRLDVCEKCTGSGAKPGTKPDKCPTCGGHGKVQQTGPGRHVPHGHGLPGVPRPRERHQGVLRHCRGKGRVPQEAQARSRSPRGQRRAGGARAGRGRAPTS
jgi:molecular chaperone DnaJ